MPFSSSSSSSNPSGSNKGIKVLKRDGQLILILPKGVSSVDIKEISDGVFALVFNAYRTYKQADREDRGASRWYEGEGKYGKREPAGSTEKSSQQRVQKGEKGKQAEQEKALRPQKELLKKLYKIPFNDRELGSLKGVLSTDEVGLLKALLKEGDIFIYKKDGKKYIAVKKSVYQKLREEEQSSKGPASFPNYAIMQPEDARKLAERAPTLYAAIRHFDGKVYLAKKNLFLEWRKLVEKVLKEEGPLHVEDLAARTGIESNAVLVVLRLMNEAGDVVEVKDHVFALASD